ncbi:wd-repeat protein [Culex quinquefasciatus]|uniref:Wd-repeat protein n=1 Tax=Culex quinquefasciatus TaxID=7176 RepID=B0XEY0_CULQU|nr:wd-repeat protein [Culex quinquefasciatus]|eukprot:XP_001868202.1 wd-repeat protein [Culex quinquefasciatus]
MDSDQEDEVPNVNFVPSLLFIKRGVAKANPDKVTLTPAELARIINETRDDLEEDGANGIDSSDDEENEDSAARLASRAQDQAGTSGNRSAGDEFGFENYEQESGEPVVRLASVAVVDPAENIQDEDDSEAEDEIIKPTDNLILVGHVQNDSASMEVYVFNDDEGSLYRQTGHICAIGCMDPVITLWDLDIQDSLEPVCKLGSKGSTKKNKPKVGHSDAVLDLSWNKHLDHILASGSVDQSVILWDMEDGTPHTIIKEFGEKVQTLAFHPTRAEGLLVGSCDGMVKVFDCRTTTNDSASFLSWAVGGEVERVCWNHHSEFHFVASTNEGRIHYCDVRRPGETLWSKEVHEKEITGLVLSSKVRGMLATASADGTLKLWDMDEEDAKLVYKKNPKMGVIQCLDECPENPFMLAMGGDLKTKNFSVVNVLDNDVVTNVFKARFDPSYVPVASGERMNIEPPTEAMEDASISDDDDSDEDEN